MGRTAKFLALAILALLLLAVVPAALAVLTSVESPGREARRELAARLQLSDLCLNTEARYLRHASLSDWQSPFQEGPGFPDLYPGGTVIPVPPADRIGFAASAAPEVE